MRADNARRHQPGDHVESWFWRANNPQARQAFWLKVTTLHARDQAPVAEAWACTFDGQRTWGGKLTVPIEQAAFGSQLRVGDCVFDFDKGTAQGSIQNAQGSARWDLSWSALGGAMSRPLSMAPHRALVDGSFPKNKVLTPWPVLGFAGQMQWSGEQHRVDGWVGMQGHNWGRAHAQEYAWGQCIFMDKERPFCVAEAFSARIPLGSRQSPLISALVIRWGERTLRFDKLVDLWRQRPRIDQDSWTLEMRSGHGSALLSMRADPQEMVCLGYKNPTGETAYCFNSKLAEVTLRVNPKHGPAFECHSAHGGALELLRDQPDPRFEVV